VHEAGTVALGELGHALQALLGGLRQRCNGAAQRQKLLFGLAHQADEDFALATALPAKAAHNLLKIVPQGVRLAL